MRALCIHGIYPGPLTRGRTNTWLLPGAQPTLIDAAEDSDAYVQRIAEALESEQPGAMLARVLVTHAHDDHIAGIAAIRRQWPGVVVAKLPDSVRDAKYGGLFEPIADDAVIPAGDGVLWAIHTPGHAPDHVCYYEPSGLELRQLRVPLGVVGIIYEGRPNVTVDAAALCLKSGNAVLLRGSSSAYESNTVLVGVMREALAGTEVPAAAVQLVPGRSRESVKDLLRARGLVDVLIPRGGASLINSVVEEATVPVIETGVGNCHVYVDAEADQDLALAILLNAKVQRPSVCNAAETLLVHAAVADTFVPRALAALAAEGVTVHGDRRIAAYGEVAPADEEDFRAEYLSLDIAAAVVDSLEEAVAHIRRYGSGHTDAIVTRSITASRRFVALVDSAAVAVNASTRFTDGGEFGFGAEIGISTQKLHARGPMGLPELTSTKWVYTGEGHLRTGAGTVVARAQGSGEVAGGDPGGLGRGPGGGEGPAGRR